MTPERRHVAFFSRTYHEGGKTPIARCADRDRLDTLAEIDSPDVRVIVNPGGTNERYAREHLRAAAVRLHSDNRSVFEEIAAGRADQCAMARPHLANPAWTLLEAAKIGHTSGVGADWPVQYLSGKNQLERNLERERQMAAQTAGLSPQEQANLAQGV